MRILLAIKPEFASKIFEGTKRYEFRKSIFKDHRVTKIVVYASSPIRKVIGEFEIDSVINAEPNQVWEETKNYSGITKDFFDLYFAGRDKAYAIKIKNTVKYDRPKSLQNDFNIWFAPQSFTYIDRKKQE